MPPEASWLSRILPSPLRKLEDEINERLGKSPLQLNEYGYDPYGFHAPSAVRMLLPSALMYRHYFRVETHGIEQVPEGGFLLIANHSGQFGYDGMMLAMAMLLDAEPPRLARGMAEFLFARTPFAGAQLARSGSLIGTPENCITMLEAGECVMVFPEGARGANKPFRKRYQLQTFGTGFMRLALETGCPIVPVGIVGAEEQQPGFANLEDFGRRFDLPSFPITISQPWFGLVGSAFALPVKYHIHFGEPCYFEGDAWDRDTVVNQKIEAVRESIRELLARGLEERDGVFW
ncbi:MAG: lysophospholipid acyltransferase family protein [Myxococcota bacterium]